ncbi:MAG TPA: hypothetical protein VJC16_01400 [Candidatus Nanoarchaeia archaeon]|nr:hypothetical protein [Candidatus Nanoarchaeia archaeon]
MRADWPLYHLQLAYDPGYLQQAAQERLTRGDARAVDGILALLSHITKIGGEGSICTVTSGGFLRPKQDTPLWRFSGVIDISGLPVTDNPGLYVRIGRAAMDLRRSGQNLRLHPIV